MRPAFARLANFSPGQLPTDHDYAVSTREYQTDQPSQKLPRSATGSVLTEARFPFFSGVSESRPRRQGFADAAQPQRALDRCGRSQNLLSKKGKAAKWKTKSNTNISSTPVQFSS